METKLAVVTKEDKWFVALSPKTGVTTQGKTINDSLANLHEAVSAYFEESYEA